MTKKKSKKAVIVMGLCPYCKRKYNIESSCTCSCPASHNNRPGEQVCDTCAEEQIKLLRDSGPKNTGSGPTHGKLSMTKKEKSQLSSILKRQNS